MKTLICLFALTLAGCSHIPPGGVAEVKVSFGIPAVFRVEKNLTNLRVTNANINVADTETRVQVALFVWDSSAKGVVMTNPKTP